MAHFQTNDILNCWHQKLSGAFRGSYHLLELEYLYIKKALPFKALNMGKRKDEYFLDADNKKISVSELLENLNLLVIKEFRDTRDLSFNDKQAQIAKSFADIFIKFKMLQIIIELEIFKDKPFSNLIYIPEVCSCDENTSLYFIHCFAPERIDKEAELTRRIGSWLKSQATIRKFEYLSYIMPSLPEPIKYLLPGKKATKPKSYRCNDDKITLHQFASDFCDDVILPKIKKILAFSLQ